MTLSTDDAVSALRALLAIPFARRDEIEYTMRFVSLTHIVPNWLYAIINSPRQWIVRHDGANYPTNAGSERDAVNNVRFNLYGTTPEADLPDFQAVCPFALIASAVRIPAQGTFSNPVPFARKTLPKSDALLRLRRMTY